MWEDPIVKETRELREEMVAEFDGDLHALWQHLQKVQEQFQDRVVSGPPKPVVDNRENNEAMPRQK
jgi:hypothetical protein